MSEFVRKQFFFNCAKKFKDSIGADSGLIKIELLKKMRKFDENYGLKKSEAED